MILNLRLWLVRVLLRLGEWIAPPVERNPLEGRVLALVKEADGLDASGEYKKWQIVAAKLQKECPDQKRRDLNLLIELAVQRLHAGD